jgi:hypothetical protein
VAVSSSTPDIVDLQGYAGDTLTRRITVLDDPAGFVAGRTWSAQVRSAWDSSEVDAEFTVYPDETGCTIMLSAEDTAGLLGLSTRRVLVPGTLTVQGAKYLGVWDVQLAPAGGGDPTTTICRGAVTISGDVTRNV